MYIRSDVCPCCVRLYWGPADPRERASVQRRREMTQVASMTVSYYWNTRGLKGLQLLGDNTSYTCHGEGRSSMLDLKHCVQGPTISRLPSETAAIHRHVVGEARLWKLR